MLPIFLKVEDSSRTSEARQAVRGLARDLGFDQAAIERAAIVVTEATTNLLKHAGGGLMVLRIADSGGAIEMFALDKGPGMSNWRDCLRDGYSTTGTHGSGLGAIARQSAFCDIYSQRGFGTAIYALISSETGQAASPPPVSGLRVAKPGQEVCGDDWGVRRLRSRTTIVVADGLGHGPDAAEASSAAIDLFRKHTDAAPKELLEAIHAGIRHSRGAAVSIAELDHERRIVNFAGLGNVAGHVFEHHGHRQMVSMNGTAGIEGRQVFRDFTYPWPENSVVVLHSDGLHSRWDLADTPGLISSGPGVIAGVLIRDHYRGTDDATVAVAK